MKHLKSFLVIMLIFSMIITIMPSNLIVAKADSGGEVDSGIDDETLYTAIEIISKMTGKKVTLKSGHSGVSTSDFRTILGIYMEFRRIPVAEESVVRKEAAGYAQGISVYETHLLATDNLFTLSGYRDINGNEINSIDSTLYQAICIGDEEYLREHAYDLANTLYKANPSCGIDQEVLKAIKEYKEDGTNPNLEEYYVVTWKLVPIVINKKDDNRAVVIPQQFSWERCGGYLSREIPRQFFKAAAEIELKNGGYKISPNLDDVIVMLEGWKKYPQYDDDALQKSIDEIKVTIAGAILQEGIMAQVCTGYGGSPLLKYGYPTDDHTADNIRECYNFYNCVTDETGTTMYGTGYYGLTGLEQGNIKYEVQDRYYTVDESGNEVELEVITRTGYPKSIVATEIITEKPLTENEMKYSLNKKNCDGSAFKYTNFRKNKDDPDTWSTDVKYLGDKLDWISTAAAGGVKGKLSASGIIRFNYEVEMSDLLLKVKDVYYNAEGEVLETVWRTPEEGEKKTRDESILLKASDAKHPASITSTYSEPKLIKSSAVPADAGLTVSSDYTEVKGKLTASCEVTFEWQCVPSGTFTAAIYDLYLDANTGKIIGRSDDSNPALNKEAGPIKRTGSFGTTLVEKGDTSDNVIDINYDSLSFPYDSDTRKILKANFTALFHKDRLYRGGVQADEAMYDECKDEPTTVLKYVVGGFGLTPNMDESFYKITGNGLAKAAYESKTDKPNYPNRAASYVRWNGIKSDFWLMYVYEVDIKNSVKVTDIFVDNNGKEIERVVREDWSPKIYTSMTEVSGDIKSLTKEELATLGYEVDGVNIFGVTLDTTKTADQVVTKKIKGVKSNVKWCNSGNNDWYFKMDTTEGAESITTGGKVNAAYEVEFTYIVDKEPKGFTIIDTYEHEDEGWTDEWAITWNESLEVTQCSYSHTDSSGVTTQRNVTTTEHIRGDYVPVKKGNLINPVYRYYGEPYDGFSPKSLTISGASYTGDDPVTGTYLSPTVIHYIYTAKTPKIEFEFAVQPQQYDDPMNFDIMSESLTTTNGYLSIHLNADGKDFYSTIRKNTYNGQYWPVEIRLTPSGWSSDYIDVNAVTVNYGNGAIYNSGSMAGYATDIQASIEGGDLVVKFNVITEFLRKWVDDELYLTINTYPKVMKASTPRAYDLAIEKGNGNGEWLLTLDYVTHMTIDTCPTAGMEKGEGIPTVDKPIKGAMNYTFPTWNKYTAQMTNTYHCVKDIPPTLIPWRWQSTPNGNASIDAYAEIIANQVGKIISKNGEDVNEDAADWSVMAGVPSTENLCIAIGGTAWIVDAGGWIYVIGASESPARWSNSEAGWYNGGAPQSYGIRRTINIEVVIQDIWGHSGESADDNNWLNLSCGCGELRHNDCIDTYCASGCSKHTGFCPDDDCTYCGTIGGDSCSEVLCACGCGAKSCCGKELSPAVEDNPETEEDESQEAVYCECGAKECDTPHVHATCQGSCSVRDMHQDGSVGAVAEGTVCNVERMPGALNMYNQTWNGQSVYYECSHDGGKTPCDFSETYTAKEFNQLLAEGYTEPDPGTHGAPYQGCTANAKISCVYPGDNVFNFQIIEYLNVYSYRAITAMRLDALCNAEITNIDSSVIDGSALGESTTNADLAFDMWRSNARTTGYKSGNGVAWFEQFADKTGASRITGACYRGTVVEGIPDKMYSAKRILWVPSIRHQKSGNEASDIGVGGFTYNDYYPDDHMTDVQKKKTDDPWQSPYYWLGDCRVQITICATADPSVLEPEFAIAPVNLGTDYWGKENELFRPVGSTNHGDKYKNHTGTPISEANQKRLATHVANAWQCANNNTNYTINIISDNLFVNAGNQRFDGDENCKDVIADVYGVDSGIKLFDYEFKGVGETHTRTHGNTYGDASGALLNGSLSHSEVFRDPLGSKLMTFGYIGDPSQDPEYKYTYEGSGEMKDKDHTLTEGLILMSGKSDKWSVMLEDFQYNKGVNFSEGGIEGYDESEGYRGWRGIVDSSWRWSPYTPYISETNYRSYGRIGDFEITSSGSPLTTPDGFKGFWSDHTYPTNVASMMTSQWGEDSGVSPSIGKVYGERCTNSGMLSWNYQWPDAGNGMIGQQPPMMICNIDMVDFCKNGVYSNAIEVTNKYYNVLSFNNDSAMPHGPDVIKDDNYRKTCVYKPDYVNVKGQNAINDIVIHDPISVEYCQLIPNNYGSVSSIYAIDESNEDMRTQSFLSYTNPKTGIVEYTTEMIDNAERNDYIVLGNTFYIWSTDFGDYNNNQTGHGQAQIPYEYENARYLLGVDDTVQGNSPSSKESNKEADGYVYSHLTEKWIDKREVKFSFPVSYINTSGVKVVVDKETWINLADVPIKYQGYGESDLQNFRQFGEHVDLEFKWGRSHMFTCLESADETKKATVTFRTTAKNNHGDTEESEWLNNMRAENYDADGIVHKECYVELVGRIGNLGLADTTDFRTSAIVKESGGMGWLIEGVVYKADETTSRSIISTANDILLDKVNFAGHHTYSVTNYSKDKDDMGGKSGIYFNFPLNSLYNEGIADEYIGNEMKLGYNLLMDIETMGEYEGVNGYQGPISASGMSTDLRDYTVDITPVYMLYDYDEEKFYPVELYSGDLGHYSRIWKAGEMIHTDVASLYTNLPVEAARRNVTPAEFAITRSVLACHPYGSAVTRAVLEDDDFIGTCSLIRLDQYNRTYNGSSLRNSYISTPNGDYADTTAIGSTDDMTKSLSGRSEFNLDTQFFPSDNRLTSKISDYAFAQNMQRYHFTVGLPSSTVAVLSQESELTTQKAINIAIEELKAEHPNSVIIIFATIEAHGEVWDLTYDASRTQGGNRIELAGGTIDNYGYAGYHTDESASLMNGFMIPIAVFDTFTNATTDLGSFGSH